MGFFFLFSLPGQPAWHGGLERTSISRSPPPPPLLSSSLYENAEDILRTRRRIWVQLKAFPPSSSFFLPQRLTGRRNAFFHAPAPFPLPLPFFSCPVKDRVEGVFPPPSPFPCISALPSDNIRMLVFRPFLLSLLPPRAIRRS